MKLIERDLITILKKCLELLISLNLENAYGRELHDTIKELEASHQFLFTRKMLNLLSELHSNLQKLQDIIKNIDTDVRNNLRDVAVIITRNVKGIATEFQLATNKMMCLLTIIAMLSMFISMSSLYYIAYSMSQANFLLVIMNFVILVLTAIIMMAIYLRLMVSLILQPTLLALSISYALSYIAVHQYIESALIVLMAFNVILLSLSLYILMGQSLAYRKAISIIIYMYQIVDSIRSYIEKHTKRERREIDEEVYRKVYGHEYLELIKYVRDTEKIG